MQATLPAHLLPYGEPLLAFGQQIASSFSATGTNAIFQTSLHNELVRAAVRPELASSHGGATGFRDIVTAAELPQLVEAYNISARKIVLFAVAFACILVPASWGMGYVDVHSDAPDKLPGEEDEESDRNSLAMEDHEEKEKKSKKDDNRDHIVVVVSNNEVEDNAPPEYYFRHSFPRPIPQAVLTGKERDSPHPEDV